MCSHNCIPHVRTCSGLAKKIFAVLVAMLALLVSGGCGGSANIQAPPPPAIRISLSQTSATVQPQVTAQFTATVSNDSSGKGVTWSMTCNASSCGSVSPTTTSSGTPTTYTAPGPPGAKMMVTLTAQAVADTRKSASVAITVPAISVSLSQTSTTVQPQATEQFSATVSNDSSGKGVTWSMTCNGATCGSVSTTATASGTPTTYTAPQLPGVKLLVTLTATAVTDTTKSASVAITVPAPTITVSVSQASAMVQPQASAQFSATVSNDPSGKGVTWSITTCNGRYCGSVSSTATASGAPTTYTAPQPPGVTLMVTLTATAVVDTTKSASVAITVPAPTTVSVSPQSVTVLAGGTQQFTATVGNDPANAGVTWQVLAALFCNGLNPFGGECQPRNEPPVIILPCSGCGTLSPVNTASGAPMTYTAPPHLTPPSQAGYWFCGFCRGTVGVVATSVTYTASSAGAGLTLPQMSVSVSPSSASVVLNRKQEFTATIKNDGTNSGVSWTLTQNGVICSPACGTIFPATTASDVAATYTAPSAASVSPLVRVTAASIEDPTNSPGVTFPLTTSSGAPACSAGSGNESLLKGHYAFLVNGGVGSFTADGAGKVTTGEEDLINLGTGGIDSTLSSYAVGPDHRGCLILTGTPPFPKSLSFVFSLGSFNSSGVATAGHIVAVPGYVSGPFQKAIATPNGAGIIRLQDPTSFKASQFSGHYSLGFSGADTQNCCGSVAIAGTFAADGVSAISSATFDINDRGTVTHLSSRLAEAFTCCDANGRGVFNTPIGNLPGMALYMINKGDAFLVADWSVNDSDGFQGVGEVIGIPSSTTFTRASLNGVSVLRTTAQSAAGPVVDVATVNADGTSAITVNDNVNNAGTFNTSSMAFNYRVASNGRVTLTGDNTPPVLYLTGQNQGFLLGTDPDVTYGILDPQAAGPFTNASFSGAYTWGTENPSPGTVTMESGFLSADGNGNASGRVDEAFPAALPQSQSLNLTYSFSADGIGNVGTGTTAILISGNKLVFINNNAMNPAIAVVEK